MTMPIIAMDARVDGVIAFREMMNARSGGKRMDDMISRKAVMEILKNGMGCTLNHIMRKVNELPSMVMEQKVGRWIPTGYDGYADGNPVYDWWECSECGWEYSGEDDTLTNYCPYCGAKMKEADE